MKRVFIIIGTLLLLLGGAYAYGLYRYADTFQANTEFGAVDVSNLSLKAAENKVIEAIKNKEITLQENGKELSRVSIEKLVDDIDLEEELTEAFNAQDPRLWFMNYFNTERYPYALDKKDVIQPTKLNRVLLEAGINNADRTPSKDASIQYTKAEGFYIDEPTQGNQVDEEALEHLFSEALQNESAVVEVNQAYVQPKSEADEPELQQLMDEIDKAASTKLTLVINEAEETPSKEQIMEWIYFDQNNQLVFSSEAIYDYLGTLNEQYATYNKERQFQSTLQGLVTVQPGTLGWSIDRETETERIQEDLQRGEDVRREPTIVGTGFGESADDDIGNSYVEIDMTHQTMFIYKDGQQVLQTPIVTGRLGTDTVPGAYSVWNKEEDSKLEGYNPHTEREYIQPVDYWIAFDDTGQGIHDANWQGAFGGDVYLTSGSLGCINTPPAIMPEVFNIIDLGMPVLIFQ